MARPNPYATPSPERLAAENAARTAQAQLLNARDTARAAQAEVLSAQRAGNQATLLKAQNEARAAQAELVNSRRTSLAANENVRALNQLGKSAGQANKGLGQFGGHMTAIAGAVGIPTTAIGTALTMIHMAHAAYDSMLHSAAVANPQAASTAETSKKLYEATVGARNVGLLNYQSRVYQHLAEQEAAKPKAEKGPLPAFVPLPVVGDVPIAHMWEVQLADKITANMHKSMYVRALNAVAPGTIFDPAMMRPPKLQSFAGMGGGEQFANMSEWSAAQQRASLAQGPAEEALLRQQRKNMMENWAGGAADEKTDALTAAIADLAGKVASLQMWGR